MLFFFALVNSFVHYRNIEEHNHPGEEQAGDDRAAQASPQGVGEGDGNKPQDTGEGGQENGLEPALGGIGDCMIEGHTAFPVLVYFFDDKHSVGDNDAK